MDAEVESVGADGSKSSVTERAAEVRRGQIVFRSSNLKFDENRAAYPQNLRALEAIRRTLGVRFKSTQNSERRKVISEARTVVFDSMVSDIFPAWYGTTWDFNGVTQIPGQGEIACGYFVTTCLRDAGFNVERVKLARQPSQTIIKTVVDSVQADTKITYQRPIGDIVEAIREQGHGLYIVGLDTHTGFVVNDGSSLAFVHSSYYRPPFSVTAESVEGVNPLADSKYRIVGKILGDRMMEKWLTGEKFEMKK